MAIPTTYIVVECDRCRIRETLSLGRREFVTGPVNLEHGITVLSARYSVCPECQAKDADAEAEKIPAD